MGLSKLMLSVIAIGLFASAQPARAWELADAEVEELRPWESGFHQTTLGSTEFSLSVIRRPFAYWLGGERLGEWTRDERRPTLSLSLVREDDFKIADLRLTPARRSLQSTDSLLSWSSLRAGYGQLFSEETAVSRGYNGAVWNPPSSIYVKTCFTF